MPVPRPPTTRSPVFVHVEPAPDTVTVPCVPGKLPTNPAPSVSVPPLWTVTVPAFLKMVSTYVDCARCPNIQRGAGENANRTAGRSGRTDATGHTQSARVNIGCAGVDVGARQRQRAGADLNQRATTRDNAADLGGQVVAADRQFVASQLGMTPAPAIEPTESLLSPAGPVLAEKSVKAPLALVMAALPPVLLSTKSTELLLVMVALPAVVLSPRNRKSLLVMLALPALLSSVKIRECRCW